MTPVPTQVTPLEARGKQRSQIDDSAPAGFRPAEQNPAYVLLFTAFRAPHRLRMPHNALPAESAISNAENRRARAAGPSRRAPPIGARFLARSRKPSTTARLAGLGTTKRLEPGDCRAAPGRLEYLQQHHPELAWALLGIAAPRICSDRWLAETGGATCGNSTGWAPGATGPSRTRAASRTIRAAIPAEALVGGLYEAWGNLAGVPPLDWPPTGSASDAESSPIPIAPTGNSGPAGNGASRKPGGLPKLTGWRSAAAPWRSPSLHCWWNSKGKRPGRGLGGIATRSEAAGRPGLPCRNRSCRVCQLSPGIRGAAERNS